MGPNFGPYAALVPSFAAFLRRNSIGSSFNRWASSSITDSTANSEIGPPGARYAATFGRFTTTSKPTTFTFSRSYGANAHMHPGCTGDPWNAPAWYLSSASAAVIRPSRFAPILTQIFAPEVGPDALN